MADVALEAVAPPEDERPEPWTPTDSFGLRLLALRRELKITQKSAAARCEVRQATWNDWEHGASPQNMAAVVERIADEFGVDRTWLMWGRRCACGSACRCSTTTSQVNGGSRQLEFDLGPPPLTHFERSLAVVA